MLNNPIHAATSHVSAVAHSYVRIRLLSIVYNNETLCLMDLNLDNSVRFNIFAKFHRKTFRRIEME